MVPLFKSHYSIGKSILTLNDPDQEKGDGGPDSIFALLLKHKIKNLVLVEDSLTGFLEARKISFKYNINLMFGLRIKLQSFEEAETNSEHKVVIFAKNDNGCKLINKIYSEIYSASKGVGNYKILKKNWNEDDLLLAIPFYDSFLYCNSFSFSNCIPDFSFCNPTFLLENNDLPTDSILNNIILEYCKSKNYNTLKTKSIFYNKKSDLESYQTYKCICNRSFGKNQSLSNPGFDGLGSREFCFESYLENNE